MAYPTDKPTERTSELDLDKFNRAMRATPEYQAFLKQEGLVDTGRGVSMNKDQRKRLEAQLGGLPKGMEIDAGGNVDTKGFNWKKWGPIIAAGAAMAIPGVGPAVMGALKAAGGTVTGIGGTSAIPSLAAGIPSTAAQVFGPFAAGTGAAVTSGLGSSIGKFLGDYTPELIGAGGAYLEGRRQSKEMERDRAFRRDQAIVDFLGRESEGGRADERQRAEMGLQATQMDPYAQARARNRANVRSSFAKGWNPQTGFSGGAPNFDMSALEPENLDKVGDYFYRNVAEAQPNVPLDSQGAEGFRQTRLSEMQNRRKREREEIMRYLSQMGRA